MRNGRETFRAQNSGIRSAKRRTITFPFVAIVLAAGVAMGGGVAAGPAQAHYTASVRANDLGWDGSGA